ncbi:MAG: proteasome-activating nucleotidase [Candidatus Ranarchaeia archaeon]
MPEDIKTKEENFSGDTYIRNLEQQKYFLGQIQKLDKERRRLQMQNQLITEQRDKLQNSIERLRQPPLITAQLTSLLEDGRAIVKSSTGPQFVVQISPIITKEELIIGSRVALNQRTFAIVEIMPQLIDPFVRGMELDESPTISYDEIGGLNNQLQEIREIIELPLTRPDLFEKVGIDPPKGVLFWGPPGTGKTLVARAVARETKAVFIRVIGSELVHKFIGEGARVVREIFQMAHKKQPAIVFIDELDAIGSRRLDAATSGDREVQRTLMQLLSALDGFDVRENVRIIAATNRPDILDMALLRPGRFDRIIEFPFPDEDGKMEIFKIHTRKMNLDKDVDFDKYAKKVKEATGADIKAICTEAGMFAIRELRTEVTDKDFREAIKKVLDKHKHEELFPELG